MKSPEQIVAGQLDAVQKRVLLKHSRFQSWGGKNDAPMPDWKDGRVLKQLGLIDFISLTSSQTYVTAFGQSVRAILKEQADAK